MRKLSLEIVGLIRLSATFIGYAAGLALVAVGAYLLDPAAGLIVGGVALAGSAVLYELRSPPAS